MPLSTAPTKQLADKRMASELDLYKLKAGWQQEKIDELTKERDFLKEQLATGKSEAEPCSRIVTLLRGQKTALAHCSCSLEMTDGLSSCRHLFPR